MCVCFNMQTPRDHADARTFRPLPGPHRDAKHCLAPIGGPELAPRLRQFEDFFNVSGFATPDDTTVYEDARRDSRRR